MATPTLITSTTFAAEDTAVSNLTNLNTTPTRRLITCSVPSFPLTGPNEHAGWCWIEVRTDLLQWVRVETQIVLTGLESGPALPAEYTGLIWRLSFEPVEWLTPRTGTFRYYTI